MKFVSEDVCLSPFTPRLWRGSRQQTPPAGSLSWRGSIGVSGKGFAAAGADEPAELLPKHSARSPNGPLLAALRQGFGVFWGVFFIFFLVHKTVFDSQC